ncbi:pseudouridine synthase [Neomegalonema sp.]|uniref:pseudouridine synthase n=1 Tax=Neomegalonema sp. TaxID=2039713 RepID=UPI00261B7A0A|nr:pseudouridine synthase [Neomegalonema sp.]MDD2869066.1 pseudouridine synthase [Neomegalonema sp.]
MNTTPDSRPPSPDSEAAPSTEGERIAKRLARAGIASRREAERLIMEGRVTVNGERLASPACVVTLKDLVTVDGVAVGAPEPAQLWRFHKPRGVVTSTKDEAGRPTIYDVLPPNLRRLMPVGRLDLSSEGLLLLTNDGELKRRLELPATASLRRYRVRAHGVPTERQLRPLMQGIEVEGVRYQPMIVEAERQTGANVWLNIGIREGKNREIRRALEAVGLMVNRLIRIGYGPFTLDDLPEGAVERISSGLLKKHFSIGGVPEGWARAGGGVLKPRPLPALPKPGAAPSPIHSPGAPARSAPAGALKSKPKGRTPTRRDGPPQSQPPRRPGGRA